MSDKEDGVKMVRIVGIIIRIIILEIFSFRASWYLCRTFMQQFSLIDFSLLNLQVRHAASQIESLCPQVINAAKILAARPKSKVR